MSKGNNHIYCNEHKSNVHNHKENTDCSCHSEECICSHHDADASCHTHSCSCHSHSEHACGCGHEHGGRASVREMLTGLCLFVLAIIAGTFSQQILSIILYLAAYTVSGYKILRNAVKNIAKGQLFDENFLMSLASIGAIIIGEYPEAAAVMLFYCIGEYLQDKAVDKSRKSITELMDVRPDYANVIRNGAPVRVSPEEVVPGDIIIVKNGEKVPLDGVVTEGTGIMDTVALTGESMPRSIVPGETVLSGFINTGETVHVRVSSSYHESTVAKILEITEHAREKKAKAEQFITKFSRYYTPFVVTAAVMIALIPSLITGELSKWLYRALIFLVVSCPCALVVSIPLGFFAGIGAASKHGILIKGGCYMEALSKLKTVVFDKTGTLTQGKFRVSQTDSLIDKNELIRLAAHAEAYSNHPVAKAITEFYGKEIDFSIIQNNIEIPGRGVKTVIDSKNILCGNIALMNENGITVNADNEYGTTVYVAIDGEYAGKIHIRDEIKHDSKHVISQLKAQNTDVVMLTGDVKSSAMHIAQELGIENVFYELLPSDKADRLEEIMKSASGICAFAGDGINDAPSLAMSDVGIAMGAMGSDSAVEAADVVLMTDELSKILKAISISKKTMTVIRQNIVFAIASKLLIMLTGALGLTGMWLAIFADVGVALIAVLNSLRAMR